MSMGARHQKWWNASEPGNVSVEGLLWDLRAMRAQAAASDGYCTVLGFSVLYSAVTLVRAGKHHGIEIDKDRLSQRVV